MILAPDDVWGTKSNSIGVFENRINFIGMKRSDVLDPKYNIIWKMADIVLANKTEGEIPLVSMNVSFDNRATWLGEVVFPNENVQYSGKDTVITHLFSWSNGNNAFKGTIDYIHLETNLDFSAAMEYLNKYNHLLAKDIADVTEDEQDEIANAIEEYNNLSDNVKSELVRGEYDALMKLGKKLANGDCSITSVCGKPAVVSGGDGTENNPYIIETDVDYYKTAIENSDFILADKWAEVEIGGNANGFIYELSVVVSSASNKSHYKIILYPLDEDAITNANAKAFISQYKDIFRKTEVEDSDKIILEDTIKAYMQLDTAAKAALNRNEQAFLEKLYIQTIFESINSAKTAEELLAAVENQLGIYETDLIMARYIISIKPTDGFINIDDFNTVYEKSKVVKAIKETDDIELIITQSAAHLKDNGVDIEKDYQLLSKEEKAKFAEYAKKQDFYNGMSIGMNLRHAMILAEVKCSDSSLSLKNAIMGTNPSGKTINNNFQLIDGNISLFNQLKYRERVFGYMYENIYLITVFEDITKYFNSACARAKEDETSVGGGGGGTGGSSGAKTGNTVSSFVIDSPAETEFANPFSDIDDHWGKMQILALAEKGIVSGYDDNTFRPDETVTRAEFVKLVTDAFELYQESDVQFSDVLDNDWYSKYIKRAVNAEIVVGSDDNRIFPNDKISREDAVVILYRYIKNKAEFQNKTYTFKDGDEISDYCIEAVNDMAYTGIVLGKGSNRFVPKGNMTRAEAVTLISNSIDYIQGGV
jgi:hypothetical protein